jgi:hypothetical protein
MDHEAANSNFESMLKWGAIITGMVLLVPLSAILGTQAAFVIGPAVVVAFAAWAGVRSGLLAKNDDTASSTGSRSRREASRSSTETQSTTTDPLTTLQERYAAGEITEAEFEHRVERIMESDEQLRAAGGANRSAGEAFDSTSPREKRERVSERE